MPESGTAAINRVLGFDYGQQRIGIATGQTITATATPRLTLDQLDGNPDWPAIEEQVRNWQPDALLVGMPFHLDGGENRMTRQVEAFANGLKKRFGLPLFFVDERLTSHEAESILKKNMKINRHNKKEVDKMAAAIIVQHWLDAFATPHNR